jgi:hypothetical protein
VEKAGRWREGRVAALTPALPGGLVSPAGSQPGGDVARLWQSLAFHRAPVGVGARGSHPPLFREGPRGENLGRDGPVRPKTFPTLSLPAAG